MDFEYPDGSVAFSIERASRSWAKRSRCQDAIVDAEIKPHFRRLFEQVPQILKTGILGSLAKNGVYRVSFPIPGEMLRAHDGGLRAMIVTDQGRIAAHGTLTDLTSAARIGAFWETAAFITAQRYLTQIFRQLNTIQRTVAEIQCWLSNERSASLFENSKILEQIETGLASDPRFLANSPFYQSALADVDRECGKIAQASLLDANTYLNDVEGLDLSGWFSANPESLYEVLPKVQAAVDSAAFALVMKAYNTSLLSLLLGRSPVMKLRSTDLRQRAVELVDGFDKIRRAADSRIGKITETFSSEPTVEQRKTEIRARVTSMLSPTQERLDVLSAALEALSNVQKKSEQLSGGPLEFCVELGPDGAIWHLAQPS